MVAAAEIATILVLSTGAGLMLQSFWKMRYINLGFQPNRLVVATLKLSGPRYREKTQQFALIQEPGTHAGSPWRPSQRPSPQPVSSFLETGMQPIRSPSKDASSHSGDPGRSLDIRRSAPGTLASCESRCYGEDC